MLRAALLAFAVTIPALAGPAWSQAAPPSGRDAPPREAAPREASPRESLGRDAPGRKPVAVAPRASSLDELFARLAAAKDEDEAKGVAGLIERRFGRSGSDTADLLLSRSGEALQGRDAALAVELLDRVTRLRPEWAEAWNLRASAFMLLGDPDAAIADLEQALAREPRHFGSWMALGQVELAGGDKKRALTAFRQALKLHPFLERAKTVVERLAPEVDGRDL